MNRQGKRYRVMKAELDKIDKVCDIIRAGPKNYMFTVNFEIIKTYKKRNSCNRQIIKLFERNLLKIIEK